MGNVYSAEATSLQTAGVQVDARQMGGKMRVFPFSFTFASAGAAPVLYLTKVPAGTRIWDLYVETDGLSSSAGIGLTMDIGDAADPNRYKDDWDADVAVAARGVIIGTGWGYAYTADSWLLATVVAAKTPADGQKFWGYFTGSQE